MSPIAQLRQRRRLPHALLAVLLLTVAQTSLVPCAMAYQAFDTQAAMTPVAMTHAAMTHAAMPVMEEHCAYCPPDAATPANVNACAFPHSPTVDIYAASAHHVDVILSSPLLHAATFDTSSLRDARAFVPLAQLSPPPSRPLTLTHCVQLK